MTHTPSNPELGDSVYFTCTGKSELKDSSGNYYPISRIDFRIYWDGDHNGSFESGEILREGSVTDVVGSAPNWSASFPDPNDTSVDPFIIDNPGCYGAASKVCIKYKEEDICTDFVMPAYCDG
ncbi:MAG: hypothetical protein R6U03_12800 [Gillisia sp.]